MIENINFIADDDVLLIGYMDGVPFQILFSDIVPYWHFANMSDFEDGFAEIFDDKLLIVLLTGSSQGGVVVLWDAETETVEHVSDGSYCVAVDMDDAKIYKLLEVSNFTTPANLQLWEVPLNTMNASDDGKCILRKMAPPDSREREDYSLRRLKNGFEIKTKEQLRYIVVAEDA